MPAQAQACPTPMQRRWLSSANPETFILALPTDSAITAACLAHGLIEPIALGGWRLTEAGVQTRMRILKLGAGSHS